MKAVVASSHFQPGEGPSRGLLRDCTTLLINRLQHYSPRVNRHAADCGLHQPGLPRHRLHPPIPHKK